MSSQELGAKTWSQSHNKWVLAQLPCILIELEESRHFGIRVFSCFPWEQSWYVWQPLTRQNVNEFELGTEEGMRFPDRFDHHLTSSSTSTRSLAAEDIRRKIQTNLEVKWTWWLVPVSYVTSDSCLSDFFQGGRFLRFFVVTFCQIFFGGGFFSSRRIRSRPRRQPHFTIITVLGCFDFGSAPMFFLIEEALWQTCWCVALACHVLIGFITN